MKLAFLDRDGTILKSCPGELFYTVEEPNFLPNTFEALRGMGEKGRR